MKLNRPKPTIEKFNLTEEQKQEIKDTLDGKPTKAIIEKWDKKGWYMSTCKKHYNAGSMSGRIKYIRLKYFGGGLCPCGSLPDYRVLYNLEGATLREHYCEACMSKSGIE